MGIIKKIVFGDPSFTESQEKKRKLFMYLVSGGLTTAANWIVYILFDLLVKSDMSVSLLGFEFSLKIAVKQIVGWIVAVVVAYFLNRITVFRSKGSIVRELITFAGARVLSFVVPDDLDLRTDNEGSGINADDLYRSICFYIRLSC